MPERVTLPQKKAPMSGAEGHRDVRRHLPVKGEFARRGMARRCSAVAFHMDCCVFPLRFFRYLSTISIVTRAVMHSPEAPTCEQQDPF